MTLQISWGRTLLATCILYFLFAWSCKEVELPKISQNELQLNYEFDSDGYTFFIQLLIQDDKVLIKDAEILEPSIETVQEFDVRWSFRKKILQTDLGVDEKIYWLQTNAAYLETDSSVDFPIVTQDSDKREFIPQEFPDALLQEAETDLEIYVVASSGNFEVSSVLDLPAGIKHYLAGTVEVNGNIVNQTAFTDNRAANVPGASLHYINTASRKIFQTFSQKDSSYRIFVQGYGDYLVSILHPNMQPKTKTIKLEERTDNQIFGQVIMLDELPTASNINNNQLYDITNSTLDLYNASTGPNAAGLSLDMQNYTAIPETYLLFYQYPASSLDSGKVYFLRSDNVGSFSTKLPSNTSYTSTNELMQDLSFYASAYGYTSLQGSVELTSPRMLDLVGFEIDPSADHSMFNTPPTQLKIITPATDLTIAQGVRQEFSASAVDTDPGDTLTFTWEVFPEDPGGGWTNTPITTETGQNPNITFAQSLYPVGQYLVKVKAQDSQGEAASPESTDSESMVITLTANSPPQLLRILTPADGTIVRPGGSGPTEIFIWPSATDADGDTITYTLEVFAEEPSGDWSETAQETKSTTLIPSIEFAAAPYTAGNYLAKVSAKDSNNALAIPASPNSDRITISVIPNNPPSDLKIAAANYNSSRNYSFSASATEIDAGDSVNYTWQTHVKTGTGAWDMANPKETKTGQNVTFYFDASYTLGEYLFEVTAEDSYGGQASVSTPNANRMLLTVNPDNSISFTIIP